MLYRIVVMLLYLIFKVMYRMRIVGRDDFPRGGVIVCSNHVHWADPLVLGAAVPRVVHFMSKVELFRMRIVGWILSLLRAFPVERGAADRAALRHCFELLKAGKALGIFPEGTRSKNGELGAGETGVAVIAMRSSVPVVPIAIVADYGRFGLCGRITVRFGEKIMVTRGEGQSRSASARAATDQIMASIAALVNQGQATLTDAGREEA